MVRTRTAAAALVTTGNVRLNGGRVTAASQAVKAGDVVTVALGRTVRVMKVTGFAERRGDADAARLLYEDPTPIFTARVGEPSTAGKTERSISCRPSTSDSATRSASTRSSPDSRSASGTL